MKIQHPQHPFNSYSIDHCSGECGREWTKHLPSTGAPVPL